MRRHIDIIKVEEDASSELPFEGASFSWFRALPKIDLHRHLTGAIRPDVLVRIAQKLKIDIPIFGYDSEAIANASILESPLAGGYKAFFRKRIWTLFQHIFRQPLGCANAIYWAIADASRDNVIYVEFRVSPYWIDPETPSRLETFIEALKIGVSAAARDFPGTLAKIILSVGRRSLIHKWPELWPSVRPQVYYDLLVSVANQHRDLIVGFDISGDEDKYTNARFLDFSETVKRAGFKLTVHAGETGDPNAIWEALRLLHADRIGHGIASQHDPELCHHLARSGITLEVCPTSNWLLGVVGSLSTHPLRELLRQGIRVTVNTDNPVLFNTSLTMEYYRLLANQQISVGEVRKLIEYSLDASFAGLAEKEVVSDHLKCFFASTKGGKASMME